MIFQEFRRQLLVVRQPDHGIQTGLFAERWGNDELQYYTRDPANAFVAPFPSSTSALAVLNTSEKGREGPSPSK